MDRLLREIRRCTVCAPFLPRGPRPVLSAHPGARILIVGQAPGTRVHETGIPWNDPSGDRLRDWMQVDRQVFYDRRRVAIVPMGFCYPGRGKSGDLPPRRECAELWHARLLAQLPRIELTLLLGRYAMARYLGARMKPTLTETVRSFGDYRADYLPLPHSSPRNNGWFARNPWFDDELLPVLRRRVRSALA